MMTATSTAVVSQRLPVDSSAMNDIVKGPPITDADSALIQHDHRRYVLVALAQHADGEAMLRDIAPLADDLVATGAHRSLQPARTGGGPR